MMKKFAIQFVVLAAVIFGALYFTFKDFDLVGQNLTNSKPAMVKRVTINQTMISAEVADSLSRRTKGLGGRSSLAPDAGMLFVFSQPDKYKFWMKGMKISLDMIFIQDSKIVGVIKNVLPPTPNVSDENLPRYSADVPFEQVLEVNAGFADSHDIHVGDSVSII